MEGEKKEGVKLIHFRLPFKKGGGEGGREGGRVMLTHDFTYLSTREGGRKGGKDGFITSDQFFLNIYKQFSSSVHAGQDSCGHRAQQVGTGGSSQGR